MLVSETEARIKWCPFARIWSYSDDGSCSGAWNRAPEGLSSKPLTEPTGCKCIASDCMAWRWMAASGDAIFDEKSIRRPKGETNPPFSNCPEGYTVVQYGTGSHYTAHKQVGTEPRLGHCGIAGRSEP